MPQLSDETRILPLISMFALKRLKRLKVLGFNITQKPVKRYFEETHASETPKTRSLVPPPPEPDFVGSALVKESSGSNDGDDDKIYFFFSERALELDCDTELTVARVARVCKVLTINIWRQLPKTCFSYLYAPLTS